MLRRLIRPASAGVTFATLALVACGGGDSGGGGDPFDALSDPTETSNGNADDFGPSSGSGDSGGGGGATEQPWLSAEQGEAWTEVEGERLVYQLLDSDQYLCTINEQQIQVSFQTNEGHSFSINGGFQGGTWFGHFTAHVGGSEPDLQYQGELSGGDVRFGVGGNALSWEGTVSRVEDRDILGAEEMPASMAVNCNSGITAAAELDGEAIEVDLTGLNLPQCRITEEGFNVDLHSPYSQDSLAAEAGMEGGGWLGNITIRRGQDLYIATISGEAEGLEVSKGSLSYSGEFEVRPMARANGEFVEGSATVTCP